MMHDRNRGFTLIELLVVIAIIGILSSVVLASLNTARTKGSDASVKSNLSTVRVQAELYYDDNSNKYTTTTVSGVDCGTTQSATSMLGGDTTISRALTSAKSNNGNVAMYCNVDTSAWAIATPLLGGGYWCIDSTGQAKSNQGTGSTAYTGLSGSGTTALSSSSDYVCN